MENLYLVCYIIYDYDTMCSSVVTWCYRSEPLLTSCVPLKTKNNYYIYLNVTIQKMNRAKAQRIWICLESMPVLFLSVEFCSMWLTQNSGMGTSSIYFWMSLIPLCLKSGNIWKQTVEWCVFKTRTMYNYSTLLSTSNHMTCSWTDDWVLCKIQGIIWGTVFCVINAPA